MRTSIVATVFLGLFTTAAAQDAALDAGRDAARATAHDAAHDTGLAAKLDAYLAPLAASHDFSGVVLVAHGADPLVQRSYGMADFELSAPFTAHSRFRIASITKAFTAAAVVMLVERGKLAYDDKLAKYVSDFPNGDKITVRHLLLHASGVGNPDTQPCGDATLDTLIQEISKKPLAFEPGTQTRYSNGGYALLARVIEKASEKSWDRFLADEIFRPLTLADTCADRNAAIVPWRAQGYVPGDGELGLGNAPCEGAWAAIGGGALLASAADLHRFARAVRDEKLFKRSALEYPYGWGVRKRYERDAIEQSGILSGFASYVAAYLDDDIYVVVLCNVQSGALVEIGKGVAALVFGKEPPALVPSPPAVMSTSEERKRWIGRFHNPNITTVEIREEGGALRLRWGDSRDTNHVTPTGPSKAFDRQDSIAMELKGTDPAAIRMRWPDGSEHEFARIP